MNGIHQNDILTKDVNNAELIKHQTSIQLKIRNGPAEASYFLNFTCE